MEDADGGLHPAVDGQSLDKDETKYLTASLSTPFDPPILAVDWNCARFLLLQSWKTSVQF